MSLGVRFSRTVRRHEPCEGFNTETRNPIPRFPDLKRRQREIHRAGGIVRARAKVGQTGLPEKEQA